MEFESCGLSDIGLGRLNNEDVWAQMPKQKFYILADGMGGHQAGEVAANESVIYLCNYVNERSHNPHSSNEWGEILKAGIEKTNAWIHELAQNDPELRGMGTTLCACLFHDETLIYGHVGDSRIYRIRKMRITQLTEDHSLKAELIAKGELDESLARSFPHKNVITRAVGTQKTVTPEIQTASIEPGDLYLLCSDGLTDRLSDEQLLAAIESTSSLKEATEELVLDAKKAGSEDNITLLLIQLR